MPLSDQEISDLLRPYISSEEKRRLAPSFSLDQLKEKTLKKTKRVDERLVKIYEDGSFLLEVPRSRNGDRIGQGGIWHWTDCYYYDGKNVHLTRSESGFTPHYIPAMPPPGHGRR